jgi:hypothetical protein
MGRSLEAGYIFGLIPPPKLFSGLFIRNNRVSVFFVFAVLEQAGVFRVCGRDQRNFLGKFLWTLQTFLSRFSLCLS